MRILSVLFVGVILAGCASSGPFAPKETARTQAGKLPPQKLAPGECGLFIWSADTAKNFIMFSRSSQKSGRWVHEGQIERLTIFKEAGTATQRQFPQTDYMSETGKKIGLSLQERQPIIDGTRYKRGFLRMTSGEDWTRVMPVVGLSACQK